MNVEMMSLVMIPQEELTNLKATQQEILHYLKELQSKSAGNAIIQNHITAKEFMAAVRICRSKFDQLVLTNQIKTVKKSRKIYVPVTEIERYFSDSSIR
jgi:hypothetical protein